VTVIDDDGAAVSQSIAVTVFDSSGSSSSWDFEAGGGDRSFGQFGWVAYASPRDSAGTVTDHTNTGAFPAVIREDSSLGGNSLALIDADAASNDLSQQFFVGTPVAVDIADALSFSFTHISNTGSSSTAPIFLRIAVEIDNASWYIAEQAVPESPSSATTSLFEFAGANWISWEDPSDGFANMAAFPTTGGSAITSGVITHIGIVMASNRSTDYALFDDVAFVTASPPEPTIGTVSISIVSGDAIISITDTDAAHTYTLETNSTLDSAFTAVPGQSFTGNGGTLDFTAPAPSDKAFYRIRVSDTD
jgi:hypothetical protein